LQRVLVTAGANGIGRAIVESFVAAGALVHVADIAAAALAEVTAHERVTGSVVDVSEGVEQLFADVRRDVEGLEVLVNNARIAGPTPTGRGLR
jgi:NAD(P)-dependent dehydrogenase (short-subunit alcohol dehydrogenase family)